MCIRQASMFNDLRSRLIAHGFTNIEYNIINSVKGIDHLHKLEKVSPHIPVHQENHDDKVVATLNGGKDHFFILDSCNRLVYQVILPWSFLYHPYVKAAILSAYNDNPCGECHADAKQDNDASIIATLKHLNRPLPEIFSVTFTSEEQLDKSQGRPLKNRHLYYKNHHHHHHHHHHLKHPHGHHHHHHHHIHKHPHSHHHHYKYHNFDGEEYNTMTSNQQYDALKLFLLKHLLLLDVKNDTFAVHSQGEEVDYHKFINITATHDSEHTHKVTEDESKTDIFGDAVVHTEELTNIPEGINAIRIEHLDHNLESEYSTISKDEILSQDSPPLKIILWYPHYHISDGQRLKDHYYVVLNSKDPKYHGHVLSDTSIDKQNDVNFEGEKEHHIYEDTTTVHHHHHYENNTQGIITNLEGQKDVALQTDFSNHSLIGNGGLITNYHQGGSNTGGSGSDNLNLQTLNQQQNSFNTHTEQITSTNFQIAGSTSESHHEIKGTSESDYKFSDQHKNIHTDSNHHQNHLVHSTEHGFLSGGTVTHNIESNAAANVSHSHIGGNDHHHYTDYQESSTSSAKEFHHKDEHASNSGVSHHQDKVEADVTDVNKNVLHHSSGLKEESSTVLHGVKKDEDEHFSEGHKEVTHESSSQTSVVVNHNTTTNIINDHQENLQINHSGHDLSNYLSTVSSDKVSGGQLDHNTFDSDKQSGEGQKVVGSDNVHGTVGSYHIAGQENVDSINSFQQQTGSHSSSFSQSSSSSYSSSSASSYSHAGGSAFSDNIHVKEEKGTDGNEFHKDYVENNKENSHGFSSSTNSNVNTIHGQGIVHGTEQNSFSNKGSDSSIIQQSGQYSGNVQQHGSSHSESYNQNILEENSNAAKEDKNTNVQHHSSQNSVGAGEKHIETDSSHTIQTGSEKNLHEGTSTGHEESHYQYGSSVHHHETKNSETHQSGTHSQSHGIEHSNKNVSGIHATQAGNYASSVSQSHGSEYSKKVTSGTHDTDEGSLNQTHSYDQDKKYTSSSSGIQQSATQSQSHGIGYANKDVSGAHVSQGGNYGSSISQSNTYDQNHKITSGDHHTFKGSQGSQQQSYHKENHAVKDNKKSPGEYDDKIFFPDHDYRETSGYHKSVPKSYHHDKKERTYLRTLDEEDAENGEPKDEDEVIDHYSKMIDWIEFPVD